MYAWNKENDRDIACLITRISRTSKTSFNYLQKLTAYNYNYNTITYAITYATVEG